MGESGSPYPNTSLAMPSPGQRNWPNSPSVQGPSPVSRHGMASPGHPTLHSPQTQVKDEHGKSTGVPVTVFVYFDVIIWLLYEHFTQKSPAFTLDLMTKL